MKISVAQGLPKAHSTHFKNISLPPSPLSCHTFCNPPTCIVPTMTIASMPPIITNAWNTSVHTTAFIPPWNGEKYRKWQLYLIVVWALQYSYQSDDSNCQQLWSTSLLFSILSIISRHVKTPFVDYRVLLVIISSISCEQPICYYCIAHHLSILPSLTKFWYRQYSKTTRQICFIFCVFMTRSFLKVANARLFHFFIPSVETGRKQTAV